VLLDEPEREVFGLEVMDLTGLKSGTVYPALARLRDLGWLRSWQEVPDEDMKRPPRTYYLLTETGASAALQAFSELALDRRALRGRPAWGHG
jgi:DNA-binding PadR family transcriptional regulator